MQIKQYDKVLLKTGLTAFIVEIFEQGKAYLADIEYQTGTETEDISHDDIQQVLS